MIRITFLFLITGSIQIIPMQSFEINYYLHTRQNLSPQQFNTQPPSNFSGTKSTKVIIHGYWQSSKKLWYRQITNEYLKKGDFNIIQVDWAEPASGDYLTVIRNAAVVGRSLGEMVTNLNQNYSALHLIGHSLGAHVAGYAGRAILKLAKTKIGRITGLDPAGPLFESPMLFQGLKRTDAEVVDVIHTDGGMFGCKKPMGTVDFYPNGGVRYQPGCSLLRSKFRALLQIVFCSHEKSYVYFIESINNRVFEGKKCDHHGRKCNSNVTAVMGEDYVNEPNSLGVFYVNLQQLS